MLPALARRYYFALLRRIWRFFARLAGRTANAVVQATVSMSSRALVSDVSDGPRDWMVD